MEQVQSIGYVDDQMARLFNDASLTDNCETSVEAADSNLGKLFILGGSTTSSKIISPTLTPTQCLSQKRAYVIINFLDSQGGTQTITPVLIGKTKFDYTLDDGATVVEGYLEAVVSVRFMEFGSKINWDTPQIKPSSRVALMTQWVGSKGEVFSGMNRLEILDLSNQTVIQSVSIPQRYAPERSRMFFSPYSIVYYIQSERETEYYNFMVTRLDLGGNQLEQSNDDYLLSSSQVKQKFGASTIVFDDTNIYVAGTVADSSYASGVKNTILVLQDDSKMTKKNAINLDLSDKSASYFYKIEVGRNQPYSGGYIYFLGVRYTASNSIYQEDTSLLYQFIVVDTEYTESAVCKKVQIFQMDFTPYLTSSPNTKTITPLMIARSQFGGSHLILYFKDNNDRIVSQHVPASISCDQITGDLLMADKNGEYNLIENYQTLNSPYYSSILSSQYFDFLTVGRYCFDATQSRSDSYCDVKQSVFQSSINGYTINYVVNTNAIYYESGSQTQTRDYLSTISSQSIQWKQNLPTLQPLLVSQRQDFDYTEYYNSSNEIRKFGYISSYSLKQDTKLQAQDARSCQFYDGSIKSIQISNEVSWYKSSDISTYFHYFKQIDQALDSSPIQLLASNTFISDQVYKNLGCDLQNIQFSSLTEIFVNQTSETQVSVSISDKEYSLEAVDKDVELTSGYLNIYQDQEFKKFFYARIICKGGIEYGQRDSLIDSCSQQTDPYIEVPMIIDIFYCSKQTISKLQTGIYHFNFTKNQGIQQIPADTLIMNFFGLTDKIHCQIDQMRILKIYDLGDGKTSIGNFSEYDEAWSILQLGNRIDLSLYIDTNITSSKTSYQSALSKTLDNIIIRAILPTLQQVDQQIKITIGCSETTYITFQEKIFSSSTEVTHDTSINGIWQMSFSLASSMQYNFYKIELEDYIDWITDIEGCRESMIALCSDPYCKNAYLTGTDTGWLYFFQGNNPAMPDSDGYVKPTLVISNSKPMLETVYIVGFASDGYTAAIKTEIRVCGQEVVQVLSPLKKDGDTKIILKQVEGMIHKINLKNLMYTTFEGFVDQNCPIETYQLCQDIYCQKPANLTGKVSLSTSGEVQINRNNCFNQTKFYLQAVTKGRVAQSLQIIMKIIPQDGGICIHKNQQANSQQSKNSSQADNQNNTDKLNGDHTSKALVVFEGTTNLNFLKKYQDFNLSGTEIKKLQNQLVNSIEISHRIDKNGQIYIKFTPFKVMISEQLKQEQFSIATNNTQKRRLRAIISKKIIQDQPEQLNQTLSVPTIPEFNRTLTNSIFQLELHPDLSQDAEDIEQIHQFVYWYDLEEDGMTVKLKVTFMHPKLVSMGDFNDKMQLKINQNEFNKHFYFESLDGSPVTMPRDAGDYLQRQMVIDVQETQDNNIQAQTVAQAQVANNMQQVLLLNIIITYLSNSAMSQVWSAMNALQVIVYLIFLPIKFPSATVELFNHVYNLVTFDIVPEQIAEPIRQFIINPPSDISFAPTFSKMNVSGYIVINMFLPLLFFVIYIFLAVLHYINYKITKRIHCSCQCLEKFVRNSEKYSKEVIDGIYNFLIRTLIELSLEISVSSLIEIIMKQSITNTERISYTISLVLLTLLITSTIAFTILIYTNNFKIMNPQLYPRFHQKYDVLWSDLKVKQDLNPTFMILFMIRRFLLAQTIVTLLLFPDLVGPISQSTIISLSSLSVCGYISKSQPFKIPKLNLIEWFNELCTLFVTVQITNMISFESYEQLQMQGLVINYTLVTMFAVNVFFVMLGITIEQIRKCIRRRELKQQIQTKIKASKALSDLQNRIKNDMVLVVQKKQQEEYKVVNQQKLEDKVENDVQVKSQEQTNQINTMELFALDKIVGQNNKQKSSKGKGQQNQKKKEDIADVSKNKESIFNKDVDVQPQIKNQSARKTGKSHFQQLIKQQIITMYEEQQTQTKQLLRNQDNSQSNSQLDQSAQKQLLNEEDNKTDDESILSIPVDSQQEFKHKKNSYRSSLPFEYRRKIIENTKTQNISSQGMDSYKSETFEKSKKILSSNHLKSTLATSNRFRRNNLNERFQTNMQIIKEETELNSSINTPKDNYFTRKMNAQFDQH